MPTVRASSTVLREVSPVVVMFAEIVDDIIDYLYDDTTTLRALTLVQKQWLPRSSFHLFSRLRWPPCKHQWPEEPTNPNEPCKCHLLDSEEGLGALHALLATTPRISNSVQDLRITMGWNNTSKVPDEQFLHAWYHGMPHETTQKHDVPTLAPVQRLTSPYELSQILNLTSRVESLEIFNFQFVPLIGTPSPRSATRTLRRLRIVAPWEPAGGYRHLPQFLSCFRSITSLSLEQLSSPVTLDLPASPSRPAVVHLQLTFASAECCSDWLGLVCAALDTSSTTTLTLARLKEDRDANESATLPLNRHAPAHSPLHHSALAHPPAAPLLPHSHHLPISAPYAQ